MNKGIHRARLFGADVLLQIETLHLACNSAGESGGVKFGDQTNARLACQEIGPCLCHRVSNGADTSQARNNNAATGHLRSSLFALGVVNRCFNSGDLLSVFIWNFNAKFIF